MTRASLLTLGGSFALLCTACGSSTGSSSESASQEAVLALRNELFAAGVVPIPAPPPVPDALFRLGQALFFDKILSGNQDISCATCHIPDFGTSDGRTLSDGVHGLGLGPNRGGGEIIPRNSPGLFALHARDALFWDGRAERSGGGLALPAAVQLAPEMEALFLPGLELMGAQAMLPPVARDEMRGSLGDNDLGDLGDGYNSHGGRPEGTLEVWTALTERLLDLPGYVGLLLEAYPGTQFQDFSFAHAGNALAAFQARAFARTDSPFQRFVKGDDRALTARQVRGALAFFGEGCASCHSGPLLSDGAFHNTGLPQLGPGVFGSALPPNPFIGVDVGRENATGDSEDRFQFRTPSLHNVALTGPWGHAGQFRRLRDMVAHYEHPETSLRNYDVLDNVSDPAVAATFVPNGDWVLSNLDPRFQQQNDIDVSAILDFLEALTADDALDLSELVPDFVPSGLPIF
jgi:cytochrome c peroxidase